MSGKLTSAQVVEGVIRSAAKSEREKAALLRRVVASLPSPLAVAPLLELVVARKCGRGRGRRDDDDDDDKEHEWGAFGAPDGLDEDLDRDGGVAATTQGRLCRAVVTALAERGGDFRQAVGDYFTAKRLLLLLDLADYPSYAESLRLLLLVLRVKRAVCDASALAADTAAVRVVLQARASSKPTPARVLAEQQQLHYCCELYLLRLLCEFCLPAEQQATAAQRTDWMAGFLRHCYAVLPLPASHEANSPRLQLQFDCVNRWAIAYLQQLLGDLVPATALLQQLFDLLGDFELIRSPALACLLENMPAQAVGPAVAQLALPTTTDLDLFESSLESIVRQISAWPLTDKLAQWMAAFVTVLIKTKRLGLLAKISSGIVLPVFVQLFVPQLFDAALPILETVLFGYRHSPDAFHKVAAVFPLLLQHCLATTDDMYTLPAVLQFPNDIHIIPASIYCALQTASIHIASFTQSTESSTNESTSSSTNESTNQSTSSSTNESSSSTNESSSSTNESSSSTNESSSSTNESSSSTNESTSSTNESSSSTTTLSKVEDDLTIPSGEVLTRVQRLCRLYLLLCKLHTGYPELYTPTLQLMERLSASGVAVAEVTDDDLQTMIRANAAWKEVPISDYALAPVETKAAKTPVGLVNLGNTCYMNSFLQLLHLAAPFRHAVLAASVEQARGSRELDALQRLFVFMALTTRRAYNPSSLLPLLPPWFARGQQQDAAEFGRYLLDRLETSCKDTVGLDDLVQRTFGGRLRSRIVCSDCGHDSTTRQPFVDLPLNFAAGVARPAIEDMLAGFLAAELMTGDDRYQCERCNGLREAVKTMQLEHAPQHLIVTLQRFYFDIFADQPAVTKIRTPVRFSDQLRVPVTVDDDVQLVDYELFGVVMHSGSSAQFGHYYAYGRVSQCARTPSHAATDDSSSSSSSTDDDRRWYCFNDARVHASHPSEFQDVSALFKNDVPYILMYRRRDAPVCIDRSAEISAERRAEVLRDDAAFASERSSRSKWSRNELGWVAMQRGRARYSSTVSQAVGVNVAQLPFGTPPPTCSESGWQRSGHYGF